MPEPNFYKNRFVAEKDLVKIEIRQNVVGFYRAELR